MIPPRQGAMRRPALLALALLAGLGLVLALRAPRDMLAGPAPPALAEEPAGGILAPPYDDAFWKHWGDGRADLAGYELTQPRYGELRQGTAVLIVVTETFANSLRVKSDPGRRPASDEFPVIKLNRVEDFPTGLYDYNLMTSAFVALVPVNGRPAGAVTKVSFSAQEWCGHAWTQALFDRDRVRLTGHSYFDGEADDSSEIASGPGLLSEDALALWARGLAAPRVAPGESVTVQLLASLKQARLVHRKAAPVSAALSVSTGSTRRRVPGGEFEVRTHRALLADGREWLFEVETAPPHRIIRWTGSDGEDGRYLGGERLAYWEMNGPGFSESLRKLGLSPRPARTP